MDSGKGGGDNINTSDIWELMRIQDSANKRAARRTAAFNFFDTATPFGSRTFEGTPGTSGFRQVESLNPQDQALLDQQRELQGLLGGFGLQQARQAGDMLSSPILGGQDLADSAQALEQATFERGRNLLQPNFQEDRQRLENQLIARGLPRDSEAFQSEIRRLDQSQQQALENLALSSVGAGRQEQSRLLSTELARRGGTLGEISALTPRPAGMPQFQGTPTIGVNPSDMGTAANIVLNQQAQQQARQDAALGGLFDIGSSFLLGSGFGF